MTLKTEKVRKDDESESSSNSDSETSTSSSSDSTSTESTSSEEIDSDVEAGKENKNNKTISKQFTDEKDSVENTSGHKRKRRVRPITICLTNCRYEIVRKVARKYNLREVTEDEAWNIYWTDFSVSLERAMDMRRFQMVNHFPGMNEICRKDLLARNLNRMRKLFPKDYDIYPKTWSLPADLGELQTYAHVRRNKTFICKPEMGCQGRGIFLIRNIKDLNPFGKIICQLYIAKPFLIDDFKFDMRIYVLMTSCDPLRVFVYKEGLARFATAKYKSPTNTNTENSYMHLTNYAVNKYSRDYIVDDEAGSKRKLSAVYRWFETRNYDISGLIESIDSVILKTIISAHPVLRHNYRTCFPNHDICSACFEILGFDILVDHKLKPYVLEVNHSPSFHTDARLDMEIKEGLLNDTISMLNVKRLDRHKVESDDRRRVQERLLVKHNPGVYTKLKKDDEKTSEMIASEAQFTHEVQNSAGFRLIYPTENFEKYDSFFEQNMSSLYQETTASQARAQCTRSQIQDYNNKKQQEGIKRMGGSKESGQQQKDAKLRPESPAADGVKIKKKSKNFPFNNFQPLHIDPNEELDRMKGIMHRGMLVRSLGIEAQVFQLLCQVGSIKPEEEKIFRRMHGFTNNLTNYIAKTAVGSQNLRKTQTAGGDVLEEKNDNTKSTEVNRPRSTRNFQDVDQSQPKLGTTPRDSNGNWTVPLAKFPQTPDIVSRGNTFTNSGINFSQKRHNDQLPSQSEAYNAYNIMSAQMTKNMNTGIARRNIAILALSDSEGTTTNLTTQPHNNNQLNNNPPNPMIPGDGETITTTKPIPDYRNRYDGKLRSGFFINEFPRKGSTYMSPKTGITFQSPTVSTTYENTGIPQLNLPGREQLRNNGWYAMKSFDSDVGSGTLKSSLPLNVTQTEPAQSMIPNWTQQPPTYTETGFNSKVHKLGSMTTDGRVLRPTTGRGSNGPMKQMEPIVAFTQMFEQKKNDGRRSGFLSLHEGNGKRNAQTNAKLKFSRDIQPNSLMLTGIRIGTAPSVRK